MTSGAAGERPARWRRAAGTAALIALVGLLAAMPTLQHTFGFAVFNLVYLYFVFFWVTQATSWNLFSGYSGYFSFGQGAFYGAGVYTAAILVARHGGSLLVALPLGALVAGLIAAASGILVFRLRKLRGEIFALFTLAVALGLGALANNWAAIDGGRGIPIGTGVNYPTWLGSITDMLYYLGLVIVLVAVGLAAALQHSRVGFGLFMIRDDERVAEAVGVPSLRYKLAVFTVCGALAGMSGALHAVQVNFISPSTAFGIEVPLFVILMSVVGGRRHWLGPVLGAVLIHTVTDRLTGAGLAELNQVLLALFLIAATLFLKGGIVSRLRERPVTAGVVVVVVAAVLLVAGDEPVITVAAVAMIAALLTLFVPDRPYRALLRRRPAPEPTPPVAAATDASETPPETPHDDTIAHS